MREDPIGVTRKSLPSNVQYFRANSTNKSEIRTFVVSMLSTDSMRVSVVFVNGHQFSDRE